MSGFNNNIDIDDRAYLIRDRDGDYFKRWRSTNWETVKTYAIWTDNIAEAAQTKMRDLPKIGYIDLVCGFSGLSLIRVL